MLTQLTTMNTTLTNLYNIFEHQFIDVRLMDTTGEFALPATVAGGLTVTAVLDSTAQHHVIVDSGSVIVGGHVSIDGSVNTYVIDGSVDVTNFPTTQQVSVTGVPHVVVDSGSVTATMSGVVHTIVDSGSIALSSVAHVIVDSGSIALSAVAHVIVDSGSIAVSNVLHVIVDGAVYVNMQAWDCVNKAWNAVRGYGHQYFTVHDTTTVSYSDNATCSLVATPGLMDVTSSQNTLTMANANTPGGVCRQIVNAQAL
jgi:hypothetical protein